MQSTTVAAHKQSLASFSVHLLLLVIPLKDWRLVHPLPELYRSVVFKVVVRRAVITMRDRQCPTPFFASQQRERFQDESDRTFERVAVETHFSDIQVLRTTRLLHFAVSFISVA